MFQERRLDKVPGPLSHPQAKTKTGVVVKGKSALVRSGLKSGQGFEYGNKRLSENSNE